MSERAVDEAFAFLRRHTGGDLLFEEHCRPLRYVIDRDGHLVAPVMIAMLHAADPVLFVPETTEGAMELQVTLEAFDEHEPAGGARADRWRIHHGDPPDVNWALLHVDAARREGLVIDGEGLCRPNPLADEEPALCRLVNGRHRAALPAVLRRFAQVSAEEPVMVAVDPLGFDVRGRAAVYRVPAPEPMNDGAAARRVLEAMYASVRGGRGRGSAGG